MSGTIKVDVQGLTELQFALKRWPVEVNGYLQSAGKEAASDVLNTVGLQRYPQSGPGNQPPAPYWERGYGMVRSTYGPAQRRDSSQRYGTRWTVRQAGYGTEIGNNASYARYLGGEEQAGWAAAIGWRKLSDVVEDKMTSITAVYDAWVNKLLRSLGLL